MRVPVHFPLQVVHVGPGVRRARPAYGPPRRRLHGLDIYGGDVRASDPMSLVFHGNLGQDVAPVDQTYTLTAPADVYQPAYTPGVFTAQFPEAPPAAPAWPMAPTDTYTPAYTPGVFTAQFPSTTPPIVAAGGAGGAPPDTSSAWWQQILPAIAGTAAVVGGVISGVVTPGARGAVTSYIVPATATAPAYRVTYNPATGQVMQVPITAGSSALPTFLQALPGAAWYQNPMVLLGGGLIAVLLIVMASRR